MITSDPTYLIVILVGKRKLNVKLKYNNYIDYVYFVKSYTHMTSQTMRLK